MATDDKAFKGESAAIQEVWSLYGDNTFGERAVYVAQHGHQFGLSDEEIAAYIDKQVEGWILTAIQGVGDALVDVLRKVVTQKTMERLAKCAVSIDDMTPKSGESD